MKKIALLFFVGTMLVSCGNDDDSTQTPEQNVAIGFEFNQNFDGQPLSSAQFSNTNFTIQHGEVLKVDRLRYLMTDITLTNEAGLATVISDYQFVDVGENVGAILDPTVMVPAGIYTVSMRFGFEDAKNITGAYPDLNAAVFNVPAPPNINLGGGYHYMQLEGDFINAASVETAFQFHTIRAVDGAMSDTQTFQDTSIPFNFGTVEVTGATTMITIDMNVAEWFKNPNKWNLNEFYRVLMPNFQAQIMMNQNGADVFTMGEVISVQ